MRTRIIGGVIAVLAIGFIFGQAPVLAHDGAHPDNPNPSPNATTSQEVGYEKVSLAYGSPGVKGRTIWGELVPFNGGDPRPWVAGANGSTTITFEEAVQINGNDLEAGSYGLHMIPAKDEWIVIFSTDASRFGIMSYKPEKDALRVTVKPEEASFQEWLSYDIVKTGELTANVNLRWENLSVGFTVTAKDHREK